MRTNKSNRKVLFLAHRVPYPPDKGDKIRGYHVLKFLCRRYDVYLACFCDDDRDWMRKDELSRLTSHYYVEKRGTLSRGLAAIRAVANRTPFSVAAFRSSRFRNYLRQLQRSVRFDIVYVFSSNVAFYAREVEAPLKIVDFCDLDSIKFKEYARKQKWPLRSIYQCEYERLSRYEKKIAKDFNHVLFVNEREKRLFRLPSSNGKLKVMANGADLGRRPQLRDFAPSFGKRPHPYLIFLGAMNYYPNADAVIWFARDIFPQLKELIPDLEFYIVGKNPPARVRELCNPGLGIFVTGYVESVASLLSGALAFVAPLRMARGVQTKILEAMSFGVPVIATREAAEALNARNGMELLVADTEAEFVRAVLSLQFDPEMRGRLVAQAVAFLRKRWDWDRNLFVLSQLVKEHLG